MSLDSTSGDRLTGKIAIVTGGVSGMGAAHVRSLTAQNARVLGVDVDPGDCEAIAGESRRDNFHLIRGDVRKASDWTRIIEACKEKFGNPNVLVNNAGIARANRLESISREEYGSVIDVNQIGPFLGMRAVIPSMREDGGGAIINICSTAAVVAYPSNFAYVASKWALRGMSKAAAIELAADGIRVNAICPGETDTPLLREDPTALPPERSRFGRWAHPEEISAAVVFLASDECAYMSGAEMVIDGTHTAG